MRLLGTGPFPSWIRGRCKCTCSWAHANESFSLNQMGRLRKKGDTFTGRWACPANYISLRATPDQREMGKELPRSTNGHNSCGRQRQSTNRKRRGLLQVQSR